MNDLILLALVAWILLPSTLAALLIAREHRAERRRSRRAEEAFERSLLESYPPEHPGWGRLARDLAIEDAVAREVARLDGLEEYVAMWREEA